MPEPPAVTDRGVDVEHRLLRDDHVRAQRDATEPDPPGFGAVAQRRGVLADHGARPDGEQVRACGDARGQHDRALPDARTEGAQVHQVQRRPREHRHRVGPDQRLHQPEPQVGGPPRGELARPEAPDEQPLGDDRQQRESEEGPRTPGEGTQVGVDEAGRGRHPQVPGLQHLRAHDQRGEEQEQLHGAACRVGDRADPGHGRCRRGRLPRGRAGGRAGRLQRGERRHRRVLVHLADRHRCQVGVPADLRAELGQQQGVRAQVVEQVRVGGDLLEPEHVSEQPGQGRLGRSDRRDVLARASGRPPRRRRREVLAVRLVAGRQRDRGEVLQVGRDHVRRQPVAQHRVDRLRVHGRRVGPHAVVADQLDGARHRFVGVDDGAGDPRHLQQHRLDLRELDPIAADLDLEVDPPVVLDLALLVDPAQVARAVDAPRRVGREPQEVRDERLLGEVVAVDVPAGQPDPGDAQLADPPAGQGAVRVVGVEDDDRVGGQGHADGHGAVGIDRGPGGGDRGLGGPVDVEEPPARPVPAHDQVVRAGLAGDEQEPQFRQVLLDRRQQRGHAAHRRDPPLQQVLVQIRPEQRRPGRLGHQRRAGRPRHPDLLDREVEGDRHALVHPVAEADAVHLGGHPHEADDARVLDRDALGAPGRAGRVDDVGQRVVRGRATFGPGEPGRPERGEACRRVVDAHDVGLHLGEVPAQVAQRQDGRRGGVAHDVADAVRREAGVQRYERGPGLERRQHGRVRPHRVVEHERDAVTRADAARPQEAGEPVGPCVQLGECQRRPVLRLHRRLVRRGVAALLEQVLHAVAGTPARPLVGRREDAGRGVRSGRDRLDAGRRGDPRRQRPRQRPGLWAGARCGVQPVRVPGNDVQRLGPEVVAVPPHDPGPLLRRPRHSRQCFSMCCLGARRLRPRRLRTRPRNSP